MIKQDDRAQLGFAEAVTNAFRFLEDEYCFRCVMQQSTFVRYESSLVYVNVFHGRSSFEVGVELGRLSSNRNDQEESFSLREIMKFFQIENNISSSYFYAKECEILKNIVLKLAGILRDCCQQFLKGDYGEFQKIKQFQNDLSDKYVINIQLERIRKKAASVWQDNDYKKFIQLYGSIEEHLSLIEKKKLEFAKKKHKSSARDKT